PAFGGARLQIDGDVGLHRHNTPDRPDVDLGERLIGGNAHARASLGIFDPDIIILRAFTKASDVEGDTFLAGQGALIGEMIAFDTNQRWIRPGVRDYRKRKTCDQAPVAGTEWQEIMIVNRGRDRLAALVGEDMLNRQLRLAGYQP